jgi:hypothetical protein
MSKVGRGSLILSDSRYQRDRATCMHGHMWSKDQMDSEVQQRQQLLKGNWDNNYAGKNAGRRKGGQDDDRPDRGRGPRTGASMASTNRRRRSRTSVRQGGANTFTGAVTTNGGQLFNDNVAVDNTYFANGLQVQQQALLPQVKTGAGNTGAKWRNHHRRGRR